MFGNERGWARRGKAWQGAARRGKARQGEVFKTLSNLKSISGLNRYLKMTKLEALEDVLFTIKKVNNYLNETDPKHPINIIDAGYTDPTLIALAEACDAALSRVGTQIEEELESERERLPYEGFQGYAVGQ